VVLAVCQVLQAEPVEIQVLLACVEAVTAQVGSAEPQADVQVQLFGSLYILIQLEH
jgi:hypothetical protein